MAVGRADLHLHTRVSDGFATVEALVDFAEHETELDLIAVTDHEDATGGHRAREYAARRGYRIDVVAGAEVTTRQGHLLALFIEDCPRSFRAIEQTLEDIHRQGGLAVVPHPLSWLTRSISRRTLDRLHVRAEPGVTFDAIETANPSPAGRVTASRALAGNRTWNLPETGGSDAHHLVHAATGWTSFPGSGPEALRDALKSHLTVPGMSRDPDLREVGLHRAALGLAWGYAATPRKMLRAVRRPRKVH